MAETITRWRVDLPRHWRPFRGEVDGGVIVVARPPGVTGSVAAQLLVGRVRVPARVGLVALAERAVEEVRSSGRDAETLGGGHASVGRLERCTRIVTFTVDRPRVEVAQVLAFVALDRVDESTDRDVVQFVGTCALSELPRFAPAFSAVVESISRKP